MGKLTTIENDFGFGCLMVKQKMNPFIVMKSVRIVNSQ